MSFNETLEKINNVLVYALLFIFLLYIINKISCNNSSENFRNSNGKKFYSVSEKMDAFDNNSYMSPIGQDSGSKHISGVLENKYAGAKYEKNQDSGLYTLDDLSNRVKQFANTETPKPANTNNNSKTTVSGHDEQQYIGAEYNSVPESLTDKIKNFANSYNKEDIDTDTDEKEIMGHSKARYAKVNSAIKSAKNTIDNLSKRVFQYASNMNNLKNNYKSSDAASEPEPFNILSSNLVPSEHMQCTIADTDNDADTYIRKRLLSGAEHCNKTYSITSKDAEQYQDKFFGFKNNVWQSSRDVDLVDKVADMYLSGSSDVAKGYRGRTIGDLFDNLTKGDKPLNNSEVMGNGNNHEELVMGNNANFMNDAQWTYDNEKTMNGGNFFDNIAPHNGSCSLNQAVQI
jgi:hypothetical protein